MVTSTQLSDWLITNHLKINLQVTKLNWVDTWIPGLFDISSQIKINGQIFEGRGTDFNDELAFIKSGAEAIERAISHSHNRSTNGVAVHCDLISAKLNAKHELLERDAFLCHYLTKTSFFLLEKPFLKNINFQTLNEKLNNSGIKLEIFRMEGYGEQASICIASGAQCPKPFEYIIGLGNGETLEQSLEKSIIEVMRNVIAFTEGNSCHHLSKNDLINKDSAEPLDHLGFGLHRDSREIFTGFSSLSNSFNKIALSPGNIEYEILQNNLYQLMDAPIFCVQAKSTSLQPLYWGKTLEKDINIPRLISFSGKPFSFNTINHLPHPLG